MIHFGGVGIPQDTIGDGIIIGHLLGTAIGMEAVHGAGVALLTDGHGAGPESAGGIAFAVIETVLGLVWLGIDDQFGISSLRIKPMESFICSNNQSVIFASDNSANQLPYRP